MVLVGHYLLGGVLGRGKFGWVSRATHQVIGYQVAVKHQPWAVGGVCCDDITGEHKECQHAEETRWRAALENEAALLSRISHPSVVALMEVVRGPLGLFVCLEDLGDTTLDSLVMQSFESRCTGLDEALASVIFKQVATGLQHLHHSGILHRDVKPENVMVLPGTHKMAPVAKLIDLGLAAHWKPSAPLTTASSRAGTVTYMAPELTSASHTYGPEVDVFSLGATLYFALKGETAFCEYTRNGRRGTTALFGLQMHHEDALDTFSCEARTVLRAMLHTNPNHRWCLSKLLALDWFSQHNGISQTVDEACNSLVDSPEGFGSKEISNITICERKIKDLEFGSDSISEQLICKNEIVSKTPASFGTESDNSEASYSEDSSHSYTSSVEERKESLVNMHCVGRVSSLLDQDLAHVLQHLGQEPWGPVGGMYNLLLHTNCASTHIHS